jgi:alkylhydroperoxidase/carboxymuconolactone decarboxylase family protein YurZ
VSHKQSHESGQTRIDVEASREEFESHIKQTLGIEPPDFWVTLWEHAPWAMEAYFKMRRPIFDGHSPDNEGFGIPQRYLELIVVALDIAQGNEWGTRVHARSALAAGAPPSDLVHTVVLTIMSCGMVSFRKTGIAVLEEIDGFTDSRESSPETETSDEFGSKGR